MKIKGDLLGVYQLWLGVFMSLSFLREAVCAGEGKYGYFSADGNSQVLLQQAVWNVRDNGNLTEFSFLTCSDGELLYQRGPSGDVLRLLLNNGTLEFHWTIGVNTDNVVLGNNLNNNKWYTLNTFRYLGNLFLNVTRGVNVLYSESVSNSTFRTYFSEIYLAGSVGVYVGRGYTGCLMEGPNVIFKDNVNGLQWTNVTWSNTRCSTDCPIDSGNPSQCINYPCQQGTCVPVGDGYRCDCPHLFNGTNCENDLSQYGCAVSPCLNEGNCTSVTNATSGRNYQCLCAQGWTGVNCEVQIEACRYDPCMNEAQCLERVDSFECNCTGTGFEGIYCEVDIDECNTTDICGAGVRCFNKPGGYTCECPVGTIGTDCQDIDECQSNPCANGGTCNNGVNSFTCDCAAGYTGKMCKTDIDDCADVTCSESNTKCVDGVNTHTCVCKDGYSGTPGSCLDINECVSNPCTVGSTCNNLENAYSCDCAPGYSGMDCDVNIDDCDPNPCENGATCADRVNGYNCTCAPGFSGAQCRTNINECAVSQPCYNGGQCVDGVNSYTCDCAAGYTGKHCGDDINECASNPCGVYSTACVQGVNSFTCTCLAGYTGTQCETDINECSSNPCQNGGTCQDLINKYNCICPPEWMGSTCNKVYDACYPSLENCKNGANCSTTSPSRDFQCSCVFGFTGSQCETNIDDCNSTSCTAPFVCYDMLNGFRCACPIGYEGPTCATEINECDSSPCQNGATCIDGLGNFTCECIQSNETVPGTKQSFLTGYQGQFCEEDINECLNVPSICLNDGSCKNEQGTFQCLCGHDSQGTYFTGSHCKEKTSYCYIADEVQNDQPACKNNGTCYGLEGDYSCTCIPGFTGRRCEINIDECESSPCQYNGTCNDGINMYTCNCIPGITGDNCEINIDDCDPDPCFNNGICIDGINSYECNCTDTGFKGDNCTINIDDCEPAPCLNGATCRDGIKEYFCDCYAGYRGDDCEIDINECAAMPCFFNSTCLQKSNKTLYAIDYPGFENLNFTYATAAGYLCECVTGSTGDNCEINIDDCNHDNCNNGTCVDLLNAFRCDCNPGYTGQYCDIEIDECEPAPCQNGATCTDKIADYDCECVPYDMVSVAYAGKNCSFELTSCRSNECHNGAACRPYLINEAQRLQDYECLCTDGYSGRYCNLSTTVSFDNSSIQTQLNNSDLNRLEVSFRFRTTLTDVILVSWTGAHESGLFLSLELKSGELVLQYHNDAGSTMATSTIQGVTFNDANWHHVKLTKSSQLSLEVTSPRCNNPSNCKLTFAYNKTVRAFYELQFGNVINSFLGNTVSASPFVGCMQDVTVQGARLTRLESYAHHSFTSVDVGCPRVDQCHSTTCNMKGDCVDLWNKFRCDCYRPNLGDTCETSYTAATFSYSDQGNSYAAFSLDQNVQNSFQQAVDISFFFRTRKPNGLIMIFGNADADYLTVELTEGHVGMRYKLCNQEAFHVIPHTEFADGNQQFVHIERIGTATSLKMSVNDHTETVTLPPDCSFRQQDLIFGGRIIATTRKKRETITAPMSLNTVSSFKGTIQDVRLNSNSLQFYPLADPSLSSLTVLTVTSANNLAESEVTDPVCNMTSPCENNSTCEDVFFNDYKCKCLLGYRGKNCSELDFCVTGTCPEGYYCLPFTIYRCNCLLGYRGKNCSELDFCVTGTCPDGSYCQSLLDGFECISTATFDGEYSFASYTRPFNDTRNINTISFKFRTLAYNGKHLLRVAKDSVNFYQFGLVSRRLVAVYKTFGNVEVSIIPDYNISDSTWYRAELTDEPGQITLGLYHADQDVDSEIAIDTGIRPTGGETLSDMLSSSGTAILLGETIANTRSPNFQGCLTEARIGGILLPFFADNLFVNNTSTRKFILDTEQALTHGCVAGLGCDNSACIARTTNSCTAGYYTQECSCKQGYEGAWCERIFDYCAIDGCQHGGQCVNRLNGAHCKCPSGYTGTRCETDVDECANNTAVCQNNGSCVNNNGSFTCDCAGRYTGQLCEISLLDNCSDDPCVNGSCGNVTVGGSQTFNCTCDPGYEGDLCNREIDYCASSPCMNDAVCTSFTTAQTFYCGCTTGITGVTCDTNINDCENNNDACKNGGTCVDGINSFTCNCSSSIYWQGDRCDVDIDECDQLQPCENGAICLNHNLGFTCACDGTGYEGTYCSVDVDECMETPDICKNGATCNNTIGSFDCNCTRGYEGPTCATPNCTDVPCQNSTCVITDQNTWMCDCPRFYEGIFCEIRGPCADDPCIDANTDRCTQDVTTDTYTCHCKPGWTGRNCSEDIDECSNPGDNECQNGATCVNTDGGYTCDCVLGYEGDHCEIDIDECSGEPCKNGGQCIDLIGGFECNCSGTGYTNDTCSDDLDECLSSPCLYGGTCLNTNGSFTCTCAEGYEGSDCSVKVEKSMDEDIIWYIVGPCVAVVLILIIIGVVLFLKCVSKRRATRGGYSPSRQEVTGSRVELGNVLKKPPPERLI